MIPIYYTDNDGTERRGMVMEVIGEFARCTGHRGQTIILRSDEIRTTPNDTNEEE